MKAIRTAIIVILVALLGIGWATQGIGLIKQNITFSKAVSEGDSLVEKKLYQKAISSYEDAIAIHNRASVKDKWINAYAKAYKDEVITKKDYAAALESLCKEQPKKAKYWELLLSYYMETGKYNEAHSSYNKSVNSGAKSEKLKKLGQEITYSYTVKKHIYTEVFEGSNGYFTLHDDLNWGVMDSAGEWLYECKYEYISPISSDVAALYTNEKGSRIIDGDAVVQSIISEKFTQTKAYSDGLLPVCTKDNTWSFYNCEDNSYKFNGFEDVSGFVKRTAAVKESGKWHLIDTDNKKVGSVEFDDVKLYGNGEYAYSNKMVASVGGKYGVFDAKGKEIVAPKYKDMDAFYGGYIAFQDDSGKWGYINENGKVIIEPKFENAKSFSNNLAAVSDGKSWGFIDKNGEIVIKNQFVDTTYFTKEGVCFVSNGEKSYYMLQLRFS